MNQDLQTLEDRLRNAVHDLDTSGMQARPPKKWSIQQIVEHLVLTYSATEAVLRSRISKERPTQARPSVAQRCGQIYVVRLGFFPHGVSAPVEVTPPTDLKPLTGEQLMAVVAEHLQRMDALLERASELFGERKRSVSHIILGPLSPAQWRRFHLVHGLHHLVQIQAIRKSNGFHAPDDV